MIENLSEFVESQIHDLDGYIWDVKYGDYSIGQDCSVKHQGLVEYQDFNSAMTDVEALDTYFLLISRPLLLASLNTAIADATLAGGGTLPPPPAPQYTINEALQPNNVFWSLKNNTDKTEYFKVRVRGVPLTRTWDYRLTLVVQGI